MYEMKSTCNLNGKRCCLHTGYRKQYLPEVCVAVPCNVISTVKGTLVLPSTVEETRKLPTSSLTVTTVWLNPIVSSVE